MEKLGVILSNREEISGPSCRAGDSSLTKPIGGALRTGLVQRPDVLPPCGLSLRSAVDPHEETALPIPRNNSFLHRAPKLMFCRRETVYLRNESPGMSEDAWALPEHASTQKSYASGYMSSRDSARATSRGRHTSSINTSDSGSDHLVFDSNFECGNLARADRILRQAPLSSAAPSSSAASADFRIQPLDEYLLHMDEEPGRRGSQWFFFRVKNLTKAKRYCFSICNFYKSKASFTKGMRPVFFSSVAHALDRRQGWRRIGDDVSYKRNSPGCESPAPHADAAEPVASQYSLTFTFDVPHDNDVCYFAFSVPYPLSRLQAAIESWAADPATRSNLEVYEMCRTVAGNVCHLLKITDDRDDHIPLRVLPWEQERLYRKAVVEEAQMRATLRQKQLEDAERARQEEEEQQRKEERRVFFVGKQKMHMSLGVLDWEQHLDEDSAAESADGSPVQLEADPRETEEAGPLVGVSALPAHGDFSSPVSSDDTPTQCRSPTPQERSKKLKPVVVISARVHPGETVSSFMCEGLIRYLLSSAPSAALLRERCVFVVVPMLNPDGVVNGFYRTNLSGTDLNRCWNKPSPLHHPTVHALKAIITDLQKTGRVISYFDFHGHSHKKGIFFYGTRMYPTYSSMYSQIVHGGYESSYASVLRGSSSPNSFNGFLSTSASLTDPGQSESGVAMAAWKPHKQVSPVEFVLSVGTTTRLLNLKHCTAAFPRVARFRGVARYVVSEELEVPLSFTVEASFHCGTHGPYKKRHFRSEDYLRFGRVLGFSIYKMLFEPLLGTRIGKMPLRADTPMAPNSGQQPNAGLSRSLTRKSGENDAVYHDRFFRDSDDDENFKDFLKDYAGPFRSKWYASINNTVSDATEEQDDSDGDAEGGADCGIPIDPAGADTESVAATATPSKSKTESRYSYIRYYSTDPSSEGKSDVSTELDTVAKDDRASNNSSERTHDSHSIVETQTHPDVSINLAARGERASLLDAGIKLVSNNSDASKLNLKPSPPEEHAKNHSFSPCKDDQQLEPCLGASPPRNGGDWISDRSSIEEFTESPSRRSSGNRDVFGPLMPSVHLASIGALKRDPRHTRRKNSNIPNVTDNRRNPDEEEHNEGFKENPIIIGISVSKPPWSNSSTTLNDPLADFKVRKLKATQTSGVEKGVAPQSLAAGSASNMTDLKESGDNIHLNFLRNNDAAASDSAKMKKAVPLALNRSPLTSRRKTAVVCDKTLLVAVDRNLLVSGTMLDIPARADDTDICRTALSSPLLVVKSSPATHLKIADAVCDYELQPNTFPPTKNDHEALEKSCSDVFPSIQDNTRCIFIETLIEDILNLAFAEIEAVLTVPEMLIPQTCPLPDDNAYSDSHFFSHFPENTQVDRADFFVSGWAPESASITNEDPSRCEIASVFEIKSTAFSKYVAEKQSLVSSKGIHSTSSKFVSKVDSSIQKSVRPVTVAPATSQSSPLSLLRRRSLRPVTSHRSVECQHQADDAIAMVHEGVSAIEDDLVFPTSLNCVQLQGTSISSSSHARGLSCHDRRAIKDSSGAYNECTVDRHSRNIELSIVTGHQARTITNDSALSLEPTVTRLVTAAETGTSKPLEGPEPAIYNLGLFNLDTTFLKDRHLPSAEMVQCEPIPNIQHSRPSIESPAASTFDDEIFDKDDDSASGSSLVVTMPTASIAVTVTIGVTRQHSSRF